MPHSELAACLKYPWYALGLCWMVTAFATKRSSRAEAHWIALARSALIGVMFYYLFKAPPHWRFLYQRLVPQTETTQLVGLALSVIGAAFAIWARLALGANWSSRATIKQGHELIVRGPYRIVRNPIYTGIFIALLGTAIALGQLRHFLGLPFLLAVWTWKIVTEQRFLRQQFGEEYARYCRDVKAFIPYVI